MYNVKTMYPDIVVFLDVDWEEKSKKNRQHFLIAELARQLEGCSKILGVERPICPWTSPFCNPGKFFQWLRFKRLRKVGSNLYIYTPFVLIHNIIAARLPMMTVLNRYLLRMLLNQVKKKIGFLDKDLVAWIHHPYQLEELGLVNEKLLIYDCHDDYLEYANQARKKDIENREKLILEKADYVFCVSDKLLKEKGEIKNIKNKGYIIPNAVEFDHFAQAKLKGNNSISKKKKTILGYMGKITERLDFQLLVSLAIKHPGWELVMIGPEESHSEVAPLFSNPYYQSFIAAPNVNLMGARSYNNLPILMRAFDVCILPYNADDPFNIHCSPLKIYEYLATGKPIVSTDLPAVRNFKGLVRIAEDIEDFERQILEALQDKDKELCQQRLEAAGNNSWQKRVETILKVIDTNLKEKSFNAQN